MFKKKQKKDDEVVVNNESESKGTKGTPKELLSKNRPH